MLGHTKNAWAQNEEGGQEISGSPSSSPKPRTGIDDVDAVHPFYTPPPPATVTPEGTETQGVSYSLSADGARPKRHHSAQHGASASNNATNLAAADGRPPLLPPSTRTLNSQLESLSNQLHREAELRNGSTGGRTGPRTSSAPATRSPNQQPITPSPQGRCASAEREPVAADAASLGRRSATPPGTPVRRRSQSHSATPTRDRSPCRRRSRGRQAPENAITSSDGANPAPRRTASPKTRDGRIKVVVRKRPLNAQEGDTDCLAVDAPGLTLSVTKHRLDLSEYTEKSTFSFDDAFDETVPNEAIYKSCTQELLSVALNGGSASCFAYGQTGSGKTYTMMGGGDEKGLYLLAAHDLFERASANHVFSVGFYEIYCNSLFDLLNRRAPVIIREDGNRRMNLRGLSWNAVQSPTQLWSLVSSGLEQRVTGSTSANERSSRSHAVLSIRVTDLTDPELSGVLNFVDLAGSERAADTANNDKQTRLEGAEINKSLLALKECIRALDEKKAHVPFRGSKLTEVLRDSFTGNSKTLMIANVSPSSLNCEHTANTLRYAFRVKGLSIALMAPSKERKVRPGVRARSAPAPPAPTEANEESGASPSASPTPAQKLYESPAHKKRRVRSRPNGVMSPTTAVAGELSDNACADDLVCEELSDDGAIGMLVPESRTGPASNEEVDVEQLEYRLKKKLMSQLQRDLGREIQQVLDERDAIIATLRQENEQLRARVSQLTSQNAPPQIP